MGKNLNDNVLTLNHNYFKTAPTQSNFFKQKDPIMKFFFGAPVLALLVASSSAQERITSEEFKAGIDSGLYDMVLDVRTDGERAAGFIPGTIHVPIDGFEENPFIDTIVGSSCTEECVTIVAHCSLGGRAEKAIESLIKLGFEGTLINGLGTNQWVDAGFELTTDEADAVIEPVCATTDICPDSMGMEETETEDSESMTSGVATLDAVGAVLAMASLFAVA